MDPQKVIIIFLVMCLSVCCISSFLSIGGDPADPADPNDSSADDDDPPDPADTPGGSSVPGRYVRLWQGHPYRADTCLLYTSDAADE